MMRNLQQLSIAILILLALAGCQAYSRAKLLHQLESSPAKNLRSYHFDPSSPLIARVRPAPEFVVALWNQADKTTAYASYTPTEAELRMIDEYISTLPGAVRRDLKERMVAIYFISEFIGSGATDYIIDDNGDIYTVMLFNPATLKVDLSIWMTYRENSAFAPDSTDVDVKINCGTRYTGFMYALVHESAHAADYVRQFTPYVERPIKLLKQISTTHTPYTEAVWRNLDKPQERYDFPGRRDLTFYGMHGKPKNKISGAPAMYKKFGATPFVSLYGSATWAEDFADSLVFYHLTQVLGEPYQIRVTRKPGEEFMLEPMKSERVKARFSFLQSLYDQEAKPIVCH